MKIATLQYSPRVGEIEDNFEQVETLLRASEATGALNGLDLLVLPELAFTGYNYLSLESIAPFLEPTAAGVSTRWAAETARRLACTVVVGYPELSTSLEGLPVDTSSKAHGVATSINGEVSLRTVSGNSTYNAQVFVDSNGSVVAHNRKTFLYYCDEVWANEGTTRFFAGAIPIGAGRKMMKAAAGICMDINPYKFEAPWTLFEFANHCRESQAKIIILSMAWTTRLSHEELFGLDEGGTVKDENVRNIPDMNTVSYWIERFRPLLNVTGPEEEVILVLANRCGEDGIAAIVGEIRYAGSSCVVGMRRGTNEGETNVRIWDIMGRCENGLLIIDTDSPPSYTVQKKDSLEI